MSSRSSRTGGSSSQRGKAAKTESFALPSTSRAPLTPRTKVAASTPSRRPGTTSSKSTRTPLKLFDVKPFVIDSQEDDIFDRLLANAHVNTAGKAPQSLAHRGSARSSDRTEVTVEMSELRGVKIEPSSSRLSQDKAREGTKARARSQEEVKQEPGMEATTITTVRHDPSILSTPMDNDMIDVKPDLSAESSSAPRSSTKSTSARPRQQPPRQQSAPIEVLDSSDDDDRAHDTNAVKTMLELDGDDEVMPDISGAPMFACRSPAESTLAGSRQTRPRHRSPPIEVLDSSDDEGLAIGLQTVKQEVGYDNIEGSTLSQDALDSEVVTPRLDETVKPILFTADSPMHRSPRYSRAGARRALDASPILSDQDDVLDERGFHTPPGIASPERSQDTHSTLLRPKSEASRSRFEKLRALAESRKTPQRIQSSSRGAGPGTRSRPTRGSTLISASGDDEDAEDQEDDDEAGSGGYDLAKHYDDSLGSLRDFIVDDSDCSLEEGVMDGTDNSDDELDELDELEHMLDGLAVGDRRSVTVKGGPVRRAIDVYDSEEEDDNEVLHYTPPRRPVALSGPPDLSQLSLDSSPPSPKRKPRDLHRSDMETNPKTPRGVGKAWRMERERIARKIFDDLNRRVFDRRLTDAAIEWNNRLLTTAGQACCKSKKDAEGTRKIVDARIKLSEKVLTGEEQIINTVAHEMCHLACFMISDEWKNAHGRVFKSWGRKVMRARPDIEVTTKHSYAIEYKYRWKCSNVNCTVTYRRHSKSIDVTKHACWRCRSPLVALFESRESNPFQEYLKENMKNAKAAMPGAAHGDVMRALARQWQAAPGDDHKSHWAALAQAQG